MTAIDIRDLTDALVSHAMTLGVFERVQAHEPKSAPGNGIHCAVFIESLMTFPRTSGLDTVSVRLTFNVRIYQTFKTKPEDLIDPKVLNAVDRLMNAYAGDFTLGGTD